MKYIYKQIPVISDELMAEMQKAIATNKDSRNSGNGGPLIDITEILQKEIIGAQYYYTHFAHNDVIYCIDTGKNDITNAPGYDDHKRNRIVTEIPKETVVHQVPVGIGEEFFMRTLAVVLHGDASPAIDAIIRKQ